jgi:Fungal chitosanase of glycosyl hydrolase group 75
MMKMFHQVLSVMIALALPAAGMAQGLQAPAPGDACPTRSLLLNFDVYHFGELRGQTPIWQLGDAGAFFFSSGMAIDADGAPNAYNADGTGLDDLFNAGQPGQWDGIVQDEDGSLILQGPDDPFPGYYVSCTALFDRTKHREDPSRFVDSTKIPYVALPGDLAKRTGARLGDIVLVSSARTGRYSYAIFADIGILGEGSIALADNLGIWSDARRGGSRAGISYFVFPGSGDGQPKSVDEINQRGASLVERWGGAEELLACAELAADKNVTPLDANIRDKALPVGQTQTGARGNQLPDATAN